jgi:multiple sugar transport system substrate-binding protein
MVFYRKDLVEKWGLEPPSEQGYSWETLTENCRKAQKKIAEENLTDTYPLIYGVKGEMAAITFQQIAWSFGADLFVDGKVPNFNTPEAKAAMELTLQWAKEGLVSPGFVEYEYPEVLTGFQEGKAVFALQWNAAAADILNPEKSPITANNTAFSVSPYQKDKGPQQLRVWPSVWAMGVSAYSKKPEEAFSYIAWFTSKEIARDYVTNGGGSSGRRSLLSDPEIVKANPQYPAMLESFKVYAAFPNLQSYPYIDASILPPHLEAIWQGTETIESALQKATEETKKYLEEQGEL